jgi:potassium/hydrogen antiporter
MSTAIIISLCVLLLVAYLFDLTSSKTKIPSVILLLFLGWVVRQATTLFSITLPDMTSVLSILGTVGLILIVLEGSLELEINRSKASLIKKSFAVAVLPLVLLAAGLAVAFAQLEGVPLKEGVLNAIPLCVISSAIAIPSVKLLPQFEKEFVIYESSLSDIIGVLLFNFVLLNTSFGWMSFGHFFLQLLIISAVSFIATLGLSFLLSKIEHPIKFAPIILLVILIYALSKVYHLPGLLFILLFGLFLGNLDELKQFKWIEKLKPDELNIEVLRFKELTIEATFLVRSLFFLLFGYMIETRELLNADTFVWAVSIVGGILALRAIFLKIWRLSLSPLLFIAPRGLITILLFLSIAPEDSIAVVNKSLIIQVIILSALVMMVGLMTRKKTEVK